MPIFFMTDLAMEKVEKQDIKTFDDIKNLVDSFYNLVRKDELIGPIFDETIGDGWDEHLPKMYSFWQTILLGEHTYTGAPFVPHMNLPIDRPHFEVWIGYWYQTVDELFSGSIAEEAKWRASRMREVFLDKLDYIRNSPNFRGLV